MQVKSQGNETTRDIASLLVFVISSVKKKKLTAAWPVTITMVDSKRPDTPSVDTFCADFTSCFIAFCSLAVASIRSL